MVNSLCCFLLSYFTSEEGADAQSVLQEATDLLHTKFGFYSITIQVELYSEDMNHCSHCQDPCDWYRTGQHWTQQDMERLRHIFILSGWAGPVRAVFTMQLPVKGVFGRLSRSPLSHKKLDSEIIHVLVAECWRWSSMLTWNRPTEPCSPPQSPSSEKGLYHTPVLKVAGGLY